MLDTAKLAQITAAFPDARDNELPAGKWTSIAANLTRELPQIPARALQQVRVYQGICRFPNNPPPP